jgi:hypothetical protein
MEQADADAAVQAVLIVGEGKAFIAGADIREFGKPPVPPSCPRCATASKPAASPWWPPSMARPWAAAWKSPCRRTTAWRCPPSWVCPKSAWACCPAPAAPSAHRA